jgi:hypothetical protein
MNSARSVNAESVFKTIVLLTELHAVMPMERVKLTD